MFLAGRNQNYRNGFQQYNEWEKTFAYGEGSSCSSESDTDSDDDKSNGECMHQRWSVFVFCLFVCWFLIFGCC